MTGAFSFRPNSAYRRRWLALAVAAVTACSAPQVVPPPPPEPPGDPWGPRPEVPDSLRAAFPVPTRAVIGQTTANSGVELLVVERRAAPAVFLRWVLPGGRSFEFAVPPRPGKPQATFTPRWPEGTTQLAADLLTMGSKRHPDTQLTAAMSRHGGSLSATALSDAVVLEGTVLSHQLAPYLRLVREALIEPTLDAKALENLRTRYRAELENQDTEADSVAARIARKLVYGEGHVYGSPGMTRESIGLVRRNHVVDAHNTAFRLGGSTLIVVGDVDAAALAKDIEQVFGADLGATDAPPVVPPPPAKATVDPKAAHEPVCHVVDMADTVQTALVLANPGPPRRVPEWPRLQLVNQILGGSASSRLFTELRERRGLTYGIYSGFEGKRAGGQWSVSTTVRTEVTGEALRLVLAEVARMGQASPEKAELQAARRYLGGQFALSLASSDSLGDWLAAMRLYDLAPDAFSQYLEALQAVTPEGAVAGVAEAGIAPGGVVVAAGRLGAIRPGIDASCPRLEERDVRGRLLRVLVGTDAEMGEAGRKDAFSRWPQSPDGRVALGRFVRDPSHQAVFRARALAALALSAASTETQALGRHAPDWRDAVAPALRPLLLAQMHTMADKTAGDEGLALPGRARAILLGMANDRDSKGQWLDGDDATADTVREAVARWAFAGLETTTPGETVRTQAGLRLAEGDVPRLGAFAHPGLEHWLAANFRRHEAALALVEAMRPAAADAKPVPLPEPSTAATLPVRARAVADVALPLGPDAALTALVQGYRRLFGQRVAPDDRDLELLAKADRPETLLLLLDVHALHEASDDAGSQQATAATMRTIRAWLQRLEDAKALGGLVDRLEAHLENLLALRNADDRWLAARLLVQHRKASGLRRVMAGLADDDHYSAARFRTVDPKQALGRFARDVVAPLGLADVQPSMLAALAGNRPVGKVIAVTVLKALGDDGSIAALRTHNDDTDVAHVLELPGPLTVRDIAQAAVDVWAYLREVREAVQAGTLATEVAAVHEEVAFFLYDLTDKRLRAEVQRLVVERQGGARQPQPETAPRAQTEPPAAL